MKLRIWLNLRTNKYLLQVRRFGFWVNIGKAYPGWAIPESYSGYSSFRSAMDALTEYKKLIAERHLDKYREKSLSGPVHVEYLKLKP